MFSEHDFADSENRDGGCVVDCRRYSTADGFSRLASSAEWFYIELALLLRDRLVETGF